jgi:hypothetical protein
MVEIARMCGVGETEHVINAQVSENHHIIYIFKNYRDFPTSIIDQFIENYSLPLALYWGPYINRLSLTP